MQQDNTHLDNLLRQASDDCTYYRKAAEESVEGSQHQQKMREMYNYMLGRWGILYEMLNTTK